MPFHKDSWNSRYTTMGDIAEKVYESVLPLGPSVRLGWNRPPVSMKRMSLMLKQMPDYYAASGHVVEVMGCGRDGVLKLKVDKYEALKQWNRLQPLVLFVFSSSASEWKLLDWRQVKTAVNVGRQQGVRVFSEDDPKEYYPIPWDRLGVEGWPYAA